MSIRLGLGVLTLPRESKDSLRSPRSSHLSFLKGTTQPEPERNHGKVLARKLQHIFITVEKILVIF